jgi:hypothetical protein
LTVPRRSVVEDKGDLHVDLVVLDLAILERHALLLDPGGGDTKSG